jgi:AcrR family transcriptional regulator
LSKEESGNSNKFMKESIFNALLALMDEKEFNDITVTNITQKAGVSRISYYRNYKSKEEIITNYINEFFEIYLEKLQGTEFEVYEYMCKFFSYIRKNKQLMNCLIRSNLSNLLLERFEFYFYFIFENLIKSDRSPMAKKYELYFIVGGLHKIIIQWVKNDLKESDEQMASILFELSH